MDTYTRVYMVATIPSCESLSSIGSAAAKWARIDDDEAADEFLKYSCNDPLIFSIAHFSLSPLFHFPFSSAPPLIFIPPCASSLPLELTTDRPPAQQAESILATQGIVAYEAYIAEVQARKATDRTEADKQRARRKARHEKIRALATKIREFASRHY